MTKFQIEAAASYAIAGVITLVSTVMLFAATAVPAANSITGAIA